MKVVFNEKQRTSPISASLTGKYEAVSSSHRGEPKTATQINKSSDTGLAQRNNSDNSTS